MNFQGLSQFNYNLKQVKNNINPQFLISAGNIFSASKATVKYTPIIKKLNEMSYSFDVEFPLTDLGQFIAFLAGSFYYPPGSAPPFG